MRAEATAAPHDPRVTTAGGAAAWWPKVKRALSVLFALVVLVLLFNWGRTVDWRGVVDAVRAYPLATLLAAAGVALASHLVYSTYDLIGKRQTRHPLPALRVAAIAFVSYAFNLNLGSLVGGFAVRFRLYARYGLPTEVIAKVLALSLLTNWVGYAFVAGAVFALRPLALPPDWKIGSVGLQILGVTLLAGAVGYVALCFVSKRRAWTIRGHRFELPGGRWALFQLGLSASNWMLIGGVIYVLLQEQVSYPAVLSVLLIAAVAGVITHVPAGLGVLEAVFVALLSHRVAQVDLLAALLCYRAIYYLAPLGVATALFAALEARASAATSAGVPASSSPDRSP